MRRPPIACRGAVQTLQPSPSQHIWISDQLLSHTLHRFLRTTCPHQKRHGSHVPGPLEARRRAAKRRMTVSANFYPQDSFPSLFDLSALFDFRSKSQPTSWRYEPPWPRSNTEPLATCTSEPATLHTASASSVSLSPNAGSSPSLVAEYALDTQQERRAHDGSAHNVAVIETMEAAVEDYGPRSFAECKPAFIAFQSRVAGAHGLVQQEQDDLLRKAYQDCCPTSEIWKYTTQVLRHMSHLELDPQAILSHQAKAKFAVPPIWAGESLDMMISLEKFLRKFPHCLPAVHKIHKQLAGNAKSVQPSNPYHQSRVLKLVQQLWLSAHLQGRGRSNSTLKLLHSIANKLHDPTRRATLTTIFGDVTALETALLELITDLKDEVGLMAPAVDVISCIPSEVLLPIVQKLTYPIAKGAFRRTGERRIQRLKNLQVWLQLLHNMDNSNKQKEQNLVDTAFASLVENIRFSRDAQRQSPLLLFTCLIIASQKAAYRDIPLSQINAALSSFYAVLDQNRSLSFDITSGVLMSQMLAKSLPTQLVVQMIVDTLVQRAGLKPLGDFLNVLNRRRLALVDASLVYSRISDQVTKVQERTNVSEHDNAVLYTCQQILRRLARISTMHGDLEVKLDKLIAERRFKVILQAAQALKMLPPTYCSLRAAIPVEERGALIHQLAHQYTADPSLTHTEAWRAIYRLYQYLQEQSLPIGPLFTKAVVRASIIRPLMENQFVSARRLIWVCDLVTKVEGEDVAKKIEANFWHWRGDLIQHAKYVQNSIGGRRQRKAHLGTMKKLGLI